MDIVFVKKHRSAVFSPAVQGKTQENYGEIWIRRCLFLAELQCSVSASHKFILPFLPAYR
jgi:hypothetical protein